MRFIVCLPTFNRAHTLPRALDSLLAQTHADWECYVLDDASTDNTYEVALKYKHDRRIHYLRWPTNRGGVAMNVEGMTIATDRNAPYDAWTRLGSDDWFGPCKLEFDNRTLQNQEACWGCYDVMPHHQRAGMAVSAEQVRKDLFMGAMRASWANCAVCTSVLRKVRTRFGFEVPGSRNMEDLVLNARIAAVADWCWRGIVGGMHLEGCRLVDGIRSDIDVFEAAWNDSPDGCTGNQAQCSIDIRASMRSLHELRLAVGRPYP